MKISILTKEGETTISCAKVSVRDGMLVLEKPILDGASTEEVWLPLTSLLMVNFIEKSEIKSETKKDEK